MTQTSWVIVVVTFAVSLGLPVAIRPLLDRLGVVDIPNARSSHSEPAIRGVGLAPAAALAVGGLQVLAALGWIAPWATLLACVITALIAALLGLSEDVRGIPTRDRAILQGVVGLAGAAAIVAVAGVGLALIPLGALAIAVYINAANFMDGIDGMSGLHGIVVGATYSAIGAIVGADWLILGGGILAAAFLGFLPWNVLHGRMFLGDVGSYLLGAMVAALAFAAFIDGVSPVALTAPVALYLADTGWTIVRRVRRGEPWLEAHRTHVYQRLTDRGLSHLQVASVVAVGSLAAGIAGLLSLEGSPSMTVLSVGMIGFIAGAYLWSASPRATAAE